MRCSQQDASQLKNYLSGFADALAARLTRSNGNGGNSNESSFMTDDTVAKLEKLLLNLQEVITNN